MQTTREQDEVMFELARDGQLVSVSPAGPEGWVYVAQYEDGVGTDDAHPGRIVYRVLVSPQGGMVRA